MALNLSILYLFFSLQAFGQTTTDPNQGNPLAGQTGPVIVTGVSAGRYSRAEGPLFNASQVTTNTISGGVAGADTDGGCASALTSSTCDSCTGTNACNTQRIHDNLELEFTIQFTPPTTTSNYWLLLSDDGQGGTGLTEIDYVEPTPGTVYPGTAPQNLTVRVRWSELCRGLFGNSNCKTAALTATAAQRLRIVFSEGDDALDLADTIFSNNLQISIADLTEAENALCQDNGSVIANPDTTISTPTLACNFENSPGDGKVFIENVQVASGFPSIPGSSADVDAIRVYFEDVASGNPTTSSSTFGDIFVTGATNGIATFSENTVGLVNGEQYNLSIGIVDTAGNTGYRLEPNIARADNDRTECYTVNNENYTDQNCHRVAPLEVLGLLEKEFDCFIATAAFDSPLASKVQDFREFRNQILHKSYVGRKLIKFYYRTSPPLARWIEKNSWAQPIVRTLLWPVWAFAMACLKAPAMVLISLLSLLMFLLLRRKVLP